MNTLNPILVAAASALMLGCSTGVATDKFTGAPVQINISPAEKSAGAKEGENMLPEKFYLTIENSENSLYSYDAVMKNEGGNWVSYDATTGERIQMVWATGTNNVQWTASTSGRPFSAPSDISVATNQSKVDSLRSSDHLYRVGNVIPAETEGCLNIDFRHMLSKIEITITLGDGHGAAHNPVTDVRIGGVQTSRSRQDSTFSTLNPFITGFVKALHCGYAAKKSVATYAAILIPQSVPDDNQVNVFEVMFKVRDKEYRWSSPDTVKLEPNTRYSLALKAEKGNVVASGLSYAVWADARPVKTQK